MNKQAFLSRIEEDAQKLNETYLHNFLIYARMIKYIDGFECPICNIHETKNFFAWAFFNWIEESSFPHIHINCELVDRMPLEIQHHILLHELIHFDLQSKGIPYLDSDKGFIERCNELQVLRGVQERNLFGVNTDNFNPLDFYECKVGNKRVLGSKIRRIL